MSNIAFGTLIILLLLVPGFALRFSFLQGPYSRVNYKPAVVNEIFWSVFPAFLFHVIGIGILNVFGYRIDFLTLIQLILPKGSAVVDYTVIESRIYGFTVYTIAISSIAYFLGHVIRRCILKFSFDKLFPEFRIKNEWFYLFSGRFEDSPDDIAFIQIDVLANVGSGNFIYSGILADYYLTSDGGIERLLLRNVYRRKLDDDSKNEDDSSFHQKELDDRYYNMPGNYFSIIRENIVNINVSYYSIEDSD